MVRAPWNWNACSDLREIETGRLSGLGDPRSKDVERAVLTALHPRLQPTDRFLGGESFGSLVGRVQPCFQQLLNDPGWKRMLIVAHGIVNLLLLSTLLGSRSGAGYSATGKWLHQRPGRRDGWPLPVETINFTPLDPLKTEATMTVMERL